jgi:hypothetical protein
LRNIGGNAKRRQRRVSVITEFDAGNDAATMHAMAEAILEYRHALGVLGRVVDLAKAGAPVALIGPGPGWRPRGAPSTVMTHHLWRRVTRPFKARIHLTWS